MVVKKKKKDPSPRSKSKMPAPKYPEINARFRQTRIEAGMTQQELAELFGTTRSTIKEIERGIVLPNLYIILQWKQKFRKSYNWILEGE